MKNLAKPGKYSSVSTFITQKQITNEHPQLKDKKKLFQPSWYKNKSEPMFKGEFKRK
jgi:hypothetical protein